MPEWVFEFEVTLQDGLKIEIFPWESIFSVYEIVEIYLLLEKAWNIIWELLVLKPWNKYDYRPKIVFNAIN